jgi:predicted nucleotide-binding protein (sugar kinase/HSP70/actin superfamily)
MESTQKTPPANVLPPKFVKEEQWFGYENPKWNKPDKKNATVLFNFVERRKSRFLSAYFVRNGYKYEDLGDHIKEDVRWGKEYGNRMQCNPLYFMSGALIRNLVRIEKETGLSKEEMVEKYIFLGGGGQCGPCRYGMYPQEFLRVLNNAGFKGFRLLIFASDIGAIGYDQGSALRINMKFRINLLISLMLADLMHVAECALRPYAVDKEAALNTIQECEDILYEAFESKLYLVNVPAALRRVKKILQQVPKKDVKLPLIYVTGEFFASLAHNDGNYNLRRFIMDEGAEVVPGLFTQRTIYDNWRRSKEAARGIKYGKTRKERRMWKKSLRKQTVSTWIINKFYDNYLKNLDPESWGGKADCLDLDEIAALGYDFYHPEIFGGEGNLEIGEAVYYADKVDGFISSKPFGCMPSSGVSDGVQSKIMSMYPQMNFLSIETSGDNEVSILGRVSMLVFKAKQKLANGNSNSHAAVSKANEAAEVPISVSTHPGTEAALGQGERPVARP